MKKTLITVILMGAMLAACGKEEEVKDTPAAREREPKVEKEEPTPVEEPEDPAEPAEPKPAAESDVKYIPLTLDNNYNAVYDKDEEYKIRFEGSYDEPVLNCDDYYALKYSLSELGSELKEYVDQASTDYMEYAYEDDAFEDDWSYYYYRTSDTQISRADTKAVCLCVSWEDFAGGVHPNYYYETYCFDTQSGKKLKLEDVIDTSKQPEMLELIEKKALEENDGLEEMLLNDLGDVLQEEADLGQLSFNLDRKGLTFYFSPYEIAAYAAGGTVVTIGYDEIPGLIKDEYKQLPADYFTEVGCTDYSDIRTLADGRTVAFNMDYDDEAGQTVHVKLDGTDYSFEDYGYYSTFYLAEKNGKNYAYRETQRDNDYVDVTVYDLNGKEPKEISYTGASFTDGAFNPDCMTMRSRGELLSTYSMVNDYRIKDDGSLEAINDYYLIKSWDGEWVVTMMQDLEAEARDSFEDQMTYTMFLSKGDRMAFYATDNETYVDFMTDNGSFVRIYVDSSDYPQQVNGIDIEELFDGIIFAG